MSARVWRVLGARRRGGIRIRWPGYAAKAAAGAVLAGMAVGCSGPPAVSRGSVTSCAQFGAEAISRHVTVTTVPPACRGLSQVEVNVAVGRALREAADGVRGKVRQRQLIARDSPYLAGLIHAVPAPASAPAAAAPPSGPPSRAALSLAALAAWLITVGLGVSMMARWLIPRLRRRAQPGQDRGPVLNFTHFGLAVTGLLVWIGYLVTGLPGLAWVACGLLILVAALGMTLVFPALNRGVLDRGPVSSPATAVAGPASSPAAVAADPAPPARRAPVLVVAAHITAASITILLAILAAIGLSATPCRARPVRPKGPGS
jgi:hypothetical protein